jgi:hypothetical protein
MAFEVEISLLTSLGGFRCFIFKSGKQNVCQGKKGRNCEQNLRKRMTTWRVCKLSSYAHTMLVQPFFA